MQQVLIVMMSSGHALGQGSGGKKLLGVLLERLNHLVQPDVAGALKPLASTSLVEIR